MHGTDDQTLSDQLSAAISDLAARDASVVICTCSTLGGAAERCVPVADVNVLRVDRPMAELAVRSGSRIGLVAALKSTFAPTRALLYDAAVAAGREITLVDAPCFDAWRHFEQGDIEGYHRDVAVCVDALDPSVDVVVLA